MNKHDFYKELMSEYSFDTEKIRTNAKKGKYAKQKISPMIIGFTAAVAVCTVVCGTLAISMLGPKGGVDLVDTGSQSLSALSSSERVRYAIEQQNKEQNSEAIHDVLVTFAQPMDSAQAKAVIEEYTDAAIPVKAVYLVDGSRISDKEQVGSVFNGDYTVSALCISCAGSAMSQLQAAPEVFLVELMTEADFDTALPMSPDAVETVEITIPDVPSEDDVPQQPTTGDNSVVVIPDEEKDDTSDAEKPESTESAEAGGDTENAGSSETSDSTIEAADPDVPPVIADTIPDGVTLPTDPEAYKADIAGAKSAYFVTDDYFFVIKENAFELYDFTGGKENSLLAVDCSGATVHWIDDDGGRLIVSGIGENGMRNKLWLVDAESRAALDLNIADAVMEGTLAEVGFNEDAKALVLNVKQDGEYYIVAYSMDGVQLEYITETFFTNAKISLLGFNEKCVYLAVSDASLTQIYAIDVYTGVSRIIRTYDNRPKVSKNYAFTHGVIMPSDTAVTGNIEIFDPATESFIATSYFDESIIFGASKHSFYTVDGIYAIANGAISRTSDLTEFGRIDWKKSLSDRYAATATTGGVVITESTYSAKNMTSALAWGKIEPQCSAEFAAAMKGAIGANNALALMQCKAAGIKDADMLTKTLSAYYTDRAVAELKRMCGASSVGALVYNNGGLGKISAEKTSLVISGNDGTTAQGKLYINIGSICGITANRIVDVTFRYEDGSWKLDTIIGK